MKTLLEQDNPLLRGIAEPVSSAEFGSDWLKELANELITIMQKENAVGVAAPQIGINKRIIVFGTDYTQSRKVDHPIPDTVLINPAFKKLSDEIETGYEGCLNCGDIMGEVTRLLEIEYSGYDLEGNLITKKANGLEARIIQHEVDHLDGILFIDRVENKDSFTTKTELRSK
ncbi:peptide deformylase [Legionella dresdenensis]|uniref:Peptide deformylase n=1 Tax=Legionella dresdenensis TaxID=450200 RepID=A0ABV8CCU1_9GAMM